MKSSSANILREYGPFPNTDEVHGVTFDGTNIWFAAGDRLNAVDPLSGEIIKALGIDAHAGTAFDGQYLFQISDDRILKIDAATGNVICTIPAPGGGKDSGLAWADGLLWVGQHRDRRIHVIDPETGQTLRTIETKRFVTGVTWVDGELWHGSTHGDDSGLRRIDAETGQVQEYVELPTGISTSGLEGMGNDCFLCGTGPKGTILSIRRPI